MSKLDHVKILINDEKPHILCISETWLNSNVTNAMINVDNYYIENDLRIDRIDTTQGKGGGLIVYVRNDVIVTPVEYNSSFNQFCKFEAKLKGQNESRRPLIFTFVYHSPNSNTENTQELAKLIENCEKNCLIFGDFNLPKTCFDTGATDAKGRPVLEAASIRFLCNLVDFPTHIRGNVLDIALVDTETKEAVLNVENVGNLGNSDHCVVKLELKVTPEFNHSKQYIHDWKKGDKEGLKSHLQNVDFHGEFQRQNTEESWSRFKEVVADSINRYIPLKPRRMKGSPIWMNSKVKNLVNRKQKFWKKFSKDRSSTNFELYKLAEKECKRGVSAAKRRFERSIADDGNKRPFAAYVKSKTKTRVNVGPLKVNGENVSDNKSMATLLNDYFVSVFTREPTGPVPTPTSMPSRSVLDSMVFRTAEVKKKLLALRPDSAPGPDRLAARFLREHADIMAPALADLYNKSMREGAVPSDWKKANVTPIFKKGSKTDPGNYRPVSLTSIPCRVMEACMRDKIVQHLEQNRLINPSQHGFMRRKSCTTNLLEFLERVTSEVDRGHAMDIIYLDFSKAFDKVPHKRLLEKMKAHSIDGNVLHWIREWLDGRQQRTVLNGECSPWQEVLSGVPQGSVLGPLAFVIFINDIDEMAEEVSVMNKFADDTKCGNVIKSEIDILALQKCLDNLVKWTEKWGMDFNVKKCKVMRVGKSDHPPNYSMKGIPLSETKEEKDIGVMVQADLKPSRQCTTAAARATSVLSQISRAFHYRDRKTFVQLYKQYVRPHLEFAVPAWSPWSVGDREALEKVQERAVRMVSGLTGKTYHERLQEIGLLTLEKRRDQFDLVQVYKIVAGKEDVESSTWFNLTGPAPDRATRLTSDPLNIRKQNPKTDIRKNFFSNRVIDNWNRLPSFVKTSKNVNVFKQHIRRLNE